MLLQCDSVQVVGEADCPRSAVMEVALVDPDLVIVDPNNIDWQVDAVITSLTAGRPNLKVVIFTESRESRAVQLALRAGASGYLLKTADRNELVDAMNQARRGEVPLAAPVASHLASQLSAPFQANSLSRRELELMGHVADGLTNKQIGRLLSVSEGTVKTYLKRIFAKLEVSNRSAAVRVALEKELLVPDATTAEPLPPMVGR